MQRPRVRTSFEVPRGERVTGGRQTSPDGDMYKAACYALAGRIGRARTVIDGLPPELRHQAAGVVFEAGHPAADAGDDGWTASARSMLERIR